MARSEAAAPPDADAVAGAVSVRNTAVSDGSRAAFIRQSASVVAAGLGLSTACTSGALADPATARIVVDRASITGRVPPGLAGLSYEKDKIYKSFFTGKNATLIAYFRHLGPSTLRIGANAADLIIWAPNGRGSTEGQVAPKDVDALAEFLRSSEWRTIYALNLGTNTEEAAADEAAYVFHALGDRLVAFEIGNECDVYARNGLRPPTYDVAAFEREWSRYRDAIKRRVPGAIFSAPSSAYRIDDWTIPFVDARASDIDIVTEHYYRGNGKSPEATIAAIDAPDRYVPKLLNKLQTLCDSHHVKGGYRLTETNSFYSGGAPGVSNAQAAALWTIDFLMTCARYRCSGLNFHGGGNGTYNPAYTPIADVRGALEARPVYYGMLFVAQMPAGDLVNASVESTADVTAYAVTSAAGTCVAIVNKEPANVVACSVDLGRPAARATSALLTGPGLAATTGTTFCGSAISPDGTWTPAPPQSASLDAHGTLVATVPAASAVLLTVR